MTHPNLDEVLRLLADQYRRRTIRVLQKTPEEDMGFDRLIDHVVQETQANSEQRNRLVIQMHHHHLPKLREQGLIEYDPDAQLVRYRPDQQVEAVMDGMSTKQSLPASND